ncbi:MAG: ATP-grasp domain-containing protein [Lewinellaceae bacterium]|nr:ATP-grasp domain-containing protein [Lewinellaceae bacterium]
MKKQQTSILIFGAGINQLTLIRAARGLGLQSVVLDVGADAPGRALADYFYCVAGDDYETTREIAARHAVSGIVTSQMEKPMRLMARLAAEMGFIFHSPEVTERSLDKWLMKQAFLRAGVPCAAGMLIRPGEAPAAERITNRGLRFPAILKPRDATSSQGVFKVDAFEDIERYLPVTRSFSRAGQAIVEEFLEGPEYSVESITCRGKTSVVQITEKFVTPFPYTVEMGHLQPAELTDEAEAAVRETVVRAIAAIGIDNSASHAELKLTKNGPRLVEIGARLGGDFISSYLASTSCGVDMDRAAIQVALGQPPDLERKWKKYACIQYARLPAGEQVIKVGYWQKLLEKPGVVFAHVNIRPGDVVPAITQSRDRPGFVIAEGKSRQAALAAAAAYVSELEGYVLTRKVEGVGV